MTKLLKTFILLLLILIPISAGLIARYQAVHFWEQHRKEFFVNGRPIFSAYDAYLFARYAEDYKRGVFKPGGVDHLRFVPDYTNYPPVIPLPSWITAKLSELFHTHIENIAFWLIPILAVLVAIPIAIWFFLEDLYLTALTGALISTISFIYITRTGINRLDTDSLILFSLFAIPLSVYLYKKFSDTKAKYLSLLLLSLVSLIFYWWYIHPGLNLLLFLFSALFIISYSLSYSNTSLKLRQIPKKDLILIFLAFNPIILFEGFFSLIKKISIYIINFGKPISGFPNIAISISELQHFNLEIIAQWTIGNTVLFILGFLGLIAFAFLRIRLFILIFPIFLMGLISLKGASRFAIFLAPVLGIGLGFLLDFAINLIKNYSYLLGNRIVFSILQILLIPILAFILIFSNLKSFHFKPLTIMNSVLAQTFIDLKKVTPDNAWIWTWWDYGYAIQYYARRATFHDGGSQLTPKTYFVALSFATPSEKIGYNVSKSIAICGTKCIENLLKEGKTAKEITQLFISGKLLKAKNTSHPIYWLFTYDEIGGKFAWISYFGTWNFDLKRGQFHTVEGALCKRYPKYENIYLCKAPRIGNFLLNISNSTSMSILLANNKFIPVKFFALRTPEKLIVRENKFANGGIAVEKVYTAFKRENKRIYNWYLSDLVAFNSNFNKMFILRYWNNKYFTKVYEFFPVGVVYKLKGKTK